MAKITIPKRSSVSILSKEDVSFIYENILLVCESDRNGYGKKEILDLAAKNVLASPSFEFVYEDYEKKMQTPTDNVFYFSAATNIQGAKRDTSNVVKNWFKHIRNAFAHNYIRMDNSAYVFEDYCVENKSKIMNL